MRYADIIVDISNENLDKTYQYIVPDELEEYVIVGSLVVIPFGKGNREINGYVLHVSDKAVYDVSLMKRITRLEEKGIAIERQLISLAIWIKENYGATLNEALKTVIPVRRKIREDNKYTVTLSEDDELVGRVYEEARSRKNLSSRARLIEELMSVRSMDMDFITNKLLISKTTIANLEKKKAIVMEADRRFRNPISVDKGVYFANDGSKRNEDDGYSLNAMQREIVDSILADYDAGVRRSYLVHGITGSGKTEVYLEIIKQVVGKGYQAIVLIPEIALTYQTVKRFYVRFGDRISIINSKMSGGERYDQSQRAKNGEIDIMIGPRSALFTPFDNLGLIIIDEEHESSYKSETPPKYHARETATERARLCGASVILGSATPSLEAYSRTGKAKGIKLFELRERVNNAKLPSVEIVDLREELRNGNKTIFSARLVELMKEALERGEQVMIFLNRRGYAGFVSCRSCGQVVKCLNCDIAMTVHKDQRLLCHYCGYERDMPSECPICKSRHIAPFGIGTQKVEEQVKDIFPRSNIIRMDADTTKLKDSHEKILSEFSKQEADILIGTQMIVKGHDFKNVTLVGVLAADLSLYASDYRACERTFQLLAQASGRAGRGDKAGHVVIQTYQPRHYSVVTASNEDYKGFYKREMIYRQSMRYPPVAHVLAVLFLSKDEKYLVTAAASIKEVIMKYGALHGPSATRHDEGGETIIIGPAPCNISKINNVYRQVIYLKQNDYGVLIKIKNYLEGIIISSSAFNKCNIQFDFNPQGMV